MSPDKLAYMANQIGRFFAHQKHDQAVASIADHLDKFWDPRMRSGILAHLEDVQLDPLVREAINVIASAAKQSRS
jgi:formate dehydrogenase subunit delta